MARRHGFFPSFSITLMAGSPAYRAARQPIAQQASKRFNQCDIENAFAAAAHGFPRWTFLRLRLRFERKISLEIFIQGRRACRSRYRIGARLGCGKHRHKDEQQKPMAIKKSELYSSLWKSCDELRGGMDAIVDLVTRVPKGARLGAEHGVMALQNGTSWRARGQSTACRARVDLPDVHLRRLRGTARKTDDCSNNLMGSVFEGDRKECAGKFFAAPYLLRHPRAGREARLLQGPRFRPLLRFGFGRAGFVQYRALLCGDHLAQPRIAR